MSTTTRIDNTAALIKALDARILILDGAMGSMIYGLGLSEEDVRGDRFKDWHKDLKNCTDVVGLTNPESDCGNPPPLSPGGCGHH